MIQNATEPSQYVAQIDALHGTPELSDCEAMMVKLNMQWRPQDSEGDRSMDHLPRKCAAETCS